MFTISPQLRTYLDRLKEPEFERTIPYMYLDTEEKISVGVGHNLTAKKDLGSLGFYVKRFTRKAVLGGDVGIPIGAPQTADRAATEAEKQNDYNFLNAHKGLKKYGPQQLAPYTTLEMKDEDISALFDKDLQGAIATAKSAFASFDSFPTPCQAGLIDIAYNVGSFKGFPNLRNAVNATGDYAGKPAAERWEAVAAESHRPGISSTRNQAVAGWFTAGAALAPK